MKHLSVVFCSAFYLLWISPASTQEVTISGTVIDATTQQPIEGVNIYTTDEGTTSDEQGHFTLTVQSGVSLTVSHIRYETQKVVARTSPLQIQLTPVVLQGEPVFLRATRAVVGETPVAFSNVNLEEINTRYTVEDVPMILAYEPGVYAYSESGNGTGYSYVSIRGFDQSRIAVLLDNVPLNDNESHQVYWVDHGDILNDAREVQIQRGIGNSLYGSSAFGGSINVITQILSESPLFSATVGYGSYNTYKLRMKYQSGPLAGNRWAISGRLSLIDSDGYRQFHDSRQRSFTLGIEPRQGFWTHRLRSLLGYENTNLAWDGVSAEDINNREKRRSSYRAYTDDFLQQVYSLNSHYQPNPSFTF
jgi:iron complex outermembrane receptor protein